MTWKLLEHQCLSLLWWGFTLSTASSTEFCSFPFGQAEGFLRKVLCPDMTKIELFGYNNKSHVWRSKVEGNLRTPYQLSGMAAVASCSRAVAASGTSTLYNVDGIMKTEEDDYVQLLQLHLRSVARRLKLRRPGSQEHHNWFCRLMLRPKFVDYA